MFLRLKEIFNIVSYRRFFQIEHHEIRISLFFCIDFIIIKQEKGHFPVYDIRTVLYTLITTLVGSHLKKETATYFQCSGLENSMDCTSMVSQRIRHNSETFTSLQAHVWASLVAQMIKNLPAVWETWLWSLGLIPGLGSSPGGGQGNPLQYSCLENPHGQRSLGGYSPRGHKQWNTTEHKQHRLTPTSLSFCPETFALEW